MYHDLRATYWWYGMKRDVPEYFALFDTCQKVKMTINDPLGCCNFCMYPSGSGKKLL
jgi:hypothetical protein